MDECEGAQVRGGGLAGRGVCGVIEGQGARPLVLDEIPYPSW